MKRLERPAGACVCRFYLDCLASSPEIVLLLFVILLKVVIWRDVDGKLLFYMQFYYLIQGIVGSSAECYADASLLISS